MSSARPKPLPKPPWLRKRLAIGGAMAGVERGLRQRRLHTICEEGQCPNRGECFSKGVATLLVMGSTCTRDCAFCAVASGRPAPLDPDEPGRVAAEVAELGLKFVVITSVTRDDLPDGGADHFAAVTRAIKKASPGVGVELLVPDFKGSAQALETVLASGPEVLAHNLETVPRLYGTVRPQAGYGRSLELIERCSAHGGPAAKSGIMLGLGETPQEVERVLAELKEAGCQLLTLGQYLAPSALHHPVLDYIHPDVFRGYRDIALEMGFAAVASEPFVRSSYLAEHYYRQSLQKNGA
jgi:lipoyl synthase